MTDPRRAAIPELRSSDDPSREAGTVLAAALRAALAGQDVVRLAIPGGSALAALPVAREELGAIWRRVALTWVDERCLREREPESNRGNARRRGLLTDPSPACCLPLYQDGETPAQAVTRASAGIDAEFGSALDVVLLGLGEDGHVASLFPSCAPIAAGLVAHVCDSPKPPADRITLTRPLLETARATILLAVGEPKRAALTRLLAGDESLPAQGLPGLQIFTDLSLDVNVDPPIHADGEPAPDSQTRSPPR